MDLQNIYRIAAREIRGMDRMNVFIAIVLPMIIIFIFNTIYQKEILHELPVAIYDCDRSELSRKLIRLIDSSPSMKVTDAYVSIDMIGKGFKDGKIEAVFYIPSNFERSIKNGMQSRIIVYKNSSNIITSNLILKEASVIVKTFSAGVMLNKLKKNSINETQAYPLLNPVKIEASSLYNPNYSYLRYLPPGLIIFTIQIAIMLSTSLAINSEFVKGTFAELLTISHGKLISIFAGKFIPYFTIYFFMSLIILFVIFPFFNIIINGSYLIVILLFIIFIAINVSSGLLISTLFNDQLLTTQFTIFINTPAFILSGFTFPIWAMASAHKILAYSMPFTYFLESFIKVANSSSSLYDISSELSILLLYTIVSFTVALIVLKYKVKKLPTASSNEI
ncbi:ABC transporter permease [Melioribacter sp. OK-6-Me]|uniref:ABC transporter permease n=1 Tax=unclassified Melioribacter TaxID=2627329 RepID=UPI003ED8C898